MWAYSPPMVKNPRLEFVKRELRKRKGKFKIVAHESGVPHTTVKNLAAGTVKNPMSATLDALHSYLQRGA
jgi:hypothetical protein